MAKRELWEKYRSCKMLEHNRRDQLLGRRVRASKELKILFFYELSE